jgi:phytoene/squalene synthetase
MIDIYNKTSYKCSAIVAKNYSTSFSIGIKMLKNEFRDPVYSVYGYVRLADEIVDTFHQHDKRALLKKYREMTYEAIENRICTNPIISSFQETVHKYNIDIELIDSFLDSMEMDLHNKVYNEENYRKYLYGSAEVVGLMCLKVFCNGDEELYKKLKEPAQALGSAFQKVNFLRDMKSDFDERGRIYFPDVEFRNFSDEDKDIIERDIEKDFKKAITGIKELPSGSKFGVYVAYMYFNNLFKKIKRCTPCDIVSERIRVNNFSKFLIFFGSFFRYNLNQI